MRYSIFGFNQEKVCNLSAIVHNNGKDVIVRLDTTDLLILNHIADFPNRSKIVKRIIDEKVFFWISYDEQELIALDSKHQNATFFCLTDVYESLLYEKEGYGSQLQEGMVVNYDTPSRSQLQDVYNNTNNNNNTNNKEKELKEKFAAFVYSYKKAGGKVRGVETEFNDFTKRHKDWKQVIPYLEMALQREIKARNTAKLNKHFFPEMKMLQTYLGKQRAWELYVTIGEKIESEVYTPSGNFSLMWDEPSNAYMYIGYYYDGMEVADGYTNDNRPNGAKIILNNARGTIIWNSLTKKWERK